MLTLVGLRYHYRFHEHLTRTFSRGPTENIQVHTYTASQDLNQKTLPLASLALA